MRIFNFLLGGYLLVVVSLFFYSFTQVDLGLTLSEWSVWLEFQKFFQQIGFFQRTFSTAWYVVTSVFLSIFYVIFLSLANKEKLSQKQVWTIILAASTILLFSYNAFSYDLFNYIFDAKIVTHYGQNPYEHKALDYPGDPMLGFMHWTHRTYPYGPVWLLVSIPLSFLGFGFLLITIMLFKTLAFVSYLGTVYFVQKILQKVSLQNQLFGMLFFALNPLVLIEGLVSAHNDMFMMFLAIWALYLVLQKRYFFSLLLLVFSIAVKFATVFFVPLFFLIIFLQKRNKKIIWDKIFYAAILCMVIPVVLASERTNYQPWYLLYILPLAAFVSKRYFIIIPSVVITIFSVIEYVPFLYLGNWDSPVPTMLTNLRIGGIVISIYLIFFWFLFRVWRKKSNVLKW